MDPVTAFSIACGVVQVVDFSLQVVSNFREIYTEGAIADNIALADQANDLILLESRLQSLTLSPSASAHLSQDDVELQQLATKCISTAKQLAVELEKVKPMSDKKREAIKSAVKAVWNGGKIHEVEKQLDEYRKALDTRILVTLSKRSDLQSASNSKAFVSLEQQVQTFVLAIQQGQTTLAQLTSDEHIATRNHITQELRQLRVSRDEKLTEQLRKSLYFSDIFVRQEEVREAHRDTFNWIFDESDAATRPWSNFAQWLRHSHGVYWIKGKAGSGKSTLMNMLVEDERTTAALKEWAEPYQLQMPRFFFWNLGSKLQKSSNGLLRALVYQLVGASTKLAGLLLSAHPSFWPFPFHEAAELDISWTNKKLMLTLKFLIEQTEVPLRVCLFIDGFDELESDRSELARAIIELTKSGRAKCCVASRALAIFENTFSSCASLMLQDLTWPDIKLYVEEKLDWNKLSVSKTDEKQWKGKVVDAIVSKADGCFLWVYLVVATILDGIAEDDTLSELEMRLELLPPEIEGLYQHLLESINPVHKAQVLQILSLATEIGFKKTDNRALAWKKCSYSLPVFALTLYFSNMTNLARPMSIAATDIIQECRTIKTAIQARAKGLIELQPVWKPLLSDLESELSDLSSLQVKFFHKSTFDYLANNSQRLGLWFGNREARAWFLKAALQARLVFLRMKTAKDDDFDPLVDSAFITALHLSDVSAEPNELLVDELRVIETTKLANGKMYALSGPRGLSSYAFVTAIVFDTFISRAAFFQMSSYVLEKISQMPREQREKETSLLLTYALAGAVYPQREASALAPQILRLGSPAHSAIHVPYAPISLWHQPYDILPRVVAKSVCFAGETTPWEVCLRSMILSLIYRRVFIEANVQETHAKKEKRATYWAEIVDIFLESDVSLDHTITLAHPSPYLTPQAFKFFSYKESERSDSQRVLQPNLSWKVSVHRIFQLTFGPHSKFRRFMDLFPAGQVVPERSDLYLQFYRESQDQLEGIDPTQVLNEHQLSRLNQCLDHYEEGALYLTMGTTDLDKIIGDMAATENSRT